MPSLPQHQQTQRSQCFHPTGTFLPFSRDDLTQSLPARFERQVEQYPTHLAVKTPSQQVTYTVLNEAANGVAQAIVAQRGTTAEPIALLLASGVSLITAILGVLKAGKSYVPLDPAYPQAQLAATLVDAQPSLLLTQQQHMALARSLTAHVGGVLDIDTDVSPSSHNPALTIAPETLAYIFYTSGSTGRPKGVMDTHGNVLHNIMRYTNTLHFCAADRMTLLQSCSFSGSVSSLFGALLNGATIFPYEVAQVGTLALAAWIAQEALTIYHSVPAIFRQVMTAGYAFPALRLVRLEGDRASPQDIALYHQQCPPHCVLVNGLGATECGLVRQYFVDKTTPVPDRLVPIGYAVPDIEVLVCDEHGNEVEPEVPGALVIRSRYLSPGYWQRPELTAAAFTADAQERSVRLYRTGDLGRRLPDGCIEHLGRQDWQHKIRGQWIDVAEVERVLRTHEAVHTAVVVTRQDDADMARLVAYVVPNRQPAPTVSSLYRHLTAHLPAAMMPTAYVMLDALPLTGHGKVDRRALPAPSRQRLQLDTPYQPPHTPVEIALANLWTEVLHREPIGITDAFLELGGDSLGAMRLLARVQDMFGLTFPLHTFLEAGTITAMSLLVTHAMASQTSPTTLARLLAEVEPQ